MAFSFSDTYRQKSRTFSISVRLATSGQSFTAGFEIGCKISLSPERHSVIGWRLSFRRENLAFG